MRNCFLKKVEEEKKNSTGIRTIDLWIIIIGRMLYHCSPKATLLICVAVNCSARIAVSAQYCDVVLRQR